MDILIRELTSGDENRGIYINDSFSVNSVLVLSMTGQRIDYTVKKIPAYEKSYNSDRFAEETDYAEYIGNPDQICYLALVENQIVGQILLQRNWNKYAYVADIKVDAHYRGCGIGRKLIEQAKSWAKEGGMPGIMLETQSNNVQACKFYESCGFVIGGFDSYVYRALDKPSDEIAIYWYLLFH